MASIMQNDEQVAALKFVESGLDEVRTLNGVLSAPPESYRLELKRGRSRTCISIDSKFSRTIDKVLRDQRRDRIRQINAKLQRFHMIQLSDEERRVMSDEAVEAAGTESETAAESGPEDLDTALEPESGDEIPDIPWFPM